MTWREIIYMCLDLLKLSSDDSYYTADHIQFFITKIRALLLKQKYSDVKKEIPESNYQTIYLDLQPYCSLELLDSAYLKSVLEVPSILSIGNTIVYPVDFYNSSIVLVPKERFKYVGHNKWLKNIIYASLGPDNHIYLKSSNPLFKYLELLSVTSIFEDIDKVCESLLNLNSCDILDTKFPLEEGLVAQVLDLTIKYLSNAIYKPKDMTNDAYDNLSDIMTFIRRNMKSNLLKLLDDGLE